MDLYTDATVSTTRDATPSGGTGGYFTDGVIGVKPRTTLRGWFMQLLVDEVRNVITGAGLTPNINLNNQLLAAIEALIAGGVTYASSADVVVGTSTSKVVTPASLTGVKSLAANGYFGLPGGLILQWGSYSGAMSESGDPYSITFPTSFPNACFLVVPSPTNASANNLNNDFVSAQSWTQSGALIRAEYPGTPNDAVSGFTWFAIGN